MWGQHHCGMYYGIPFNESSRYARVMPAYDRGNVHCGGKDRNGSTIILLVVLYILLIIVGSTFY